ncbi:hypothetical protein D6C86_10467 [Aureobasidium pullulans]|nr:hypothetical protein D6C87_10662 [Aureobasidium pullulans]THZ51551.1 hypothetical protein D6C86_10467 [Aureobasidium pullulans]THZ99358.1 hypothetical protein D6C88_00567 [Aureobasidium pullulans]
MTSTTAHHRPQSLPCVLPQINHTLFGGKYNSPFVRAYSPSLFTYGIPEASFLSFIDGLNETFITNPALESVTHVGALIGKAVKFASKGASSTMSSKRSKVFLEEVNRDVFTPHGLKVEVLPTYQMLQIIGCPPNQFKFSTIPPPWTTPAAGDDVNSFAMHQQEQAQVMRMRALDGFVMPLTYHTTITAPAAANTDDWLKRMGEKQAAKKTASQTAKKSGKLCRRSRQTRQEKSVKPESNTMKKYTN